MEDDNEPNFNKEQQGSLKDKDKERLKTIIGKKFQTVMIGSLSQFENAFGYLWGCGKSFDLLTDDEKIFYERWQECRENILNNGNRQQRNFYAELEQYNIARNKYVTVFVPRNH